MLRRKSSEKEKKQFQKRKKSNTTSINGESPEIHFSQKSTQQKIKTYLL